MESLHHKNSCLSHIHTTPFFDRMMSSKECVFCLCSLNHSHFILPTLSSLLSLLPLHLYLPHDSGGGRDGGRRGQDGDTGGHSGGDVVRPEAPPDQLKVDCLASVSEHFHCLLIGVALDVYTIDLQMAMICEPVD